MKRRVPQDIKEKRKKAPSPPHLLTVAPAASPSATSDLTEAALVREGGGTSNCAGDRLVMSVGNGGQDDEASFHQTFSSDVF